MLIPPETQYDATHGEQGKETSLEMRDLQTGAAGVALTPGWIGKEWPWVPFQRIYEPLVLVATPCPQLASPKIPSSDSPALLRR